MTSLQQPSLIPISDKWYRLTQDYQYTWEAENNTWRVVVFAGFETDIASVPRVVWTITGIIPDGLHRAAAVIHDLLYMASGAPKKPNGTLEYFSSVFGSWQACKLPMGRKNCDRLFCRIMKEAGVSKLKRDLMYQKVREFGWIPWRNYQKRI